MTCVIGIAGALLGGRAATKLLHLHHHALQGFFNLSTQVTAIIGAAVLLLAYHLITSRGGPAGSPTAENHRALPPGCRS